ncbi:MAG: IS200/IS605 family transposase [Peptococcaceae bacterium]|nr:IS200/IS605 family transposase [Peptococcaceae bacterium]
MESVTRHCTYNVNYHIVFCPKYRRKVIRGKVEETIKQTVSEICGNYGYTLIQMETMPDHLHIFLSAPPTVAPTDIVKILKSITANTIFRTFPALKRKYFWGSGLWSRGYYIGTAGSVSAETIKRYIENQKGGEKECPVTKK